MAKKAYVGVNNIARNVKAIYVGVNGVARKVVKGYVGVNDVARMFWDGNISPKYAIGDIYEIYVDSLNAINGVFDHFLSLCTAMTAEARTAFNSYRNNMISYIADYSYFTTNFYWAGVAIFYYPDLYGDGYYFGVEIIGIRKPYPEIVNAEITSIYNTKYSFYELDGNYEDYNYVGFKITQQSGYEEIGFEHGGEVLDFLEYLYEEHDYGATIGIECDFIETIYKVLSYAFHVNYQVNHKYNLNKTNIEKTIRMAIQLFLNKNKGNNTDSDYLILKNNINTIVNYFLGYVQSYNIALVDIYYDSQNNYIDMAVEYSSTNMANQIIVNEQVSEGSKYYMFNADTDGQDLDIDYIAWAHITNPITYGQNSSPSVDPYRIIGASVYSYNGWYEVSLSNLGIDF